MILDLFAGPGGWDEGARIAGYTGPIVGIEHNHDACHTAVTAGHLRIQADVATYPMAPFAGKLDGLIASPPCQSFSRAGNRKGLADDRGQLVWQPLRWARDLRPAWVACEQVPDVLPIWQIVAAALREIGYSAWTGVLNAADFGVPQTRRRAILMAQLHGPARAPEPSHGRNASAGLFGDVEPWVTMADALGWEPDRGVALRNNSQSNACVRRLDEPAGTIFFGGPANAVDWVHERPATTVQCDPRVGRPGHKDRDKGEAQFEQGSVRVTVAEAAQLQSFRADYPWQGTKTKQYQQIGNAIPPLLAAAVLRQFVGTGTSAVAA